jgi:hypothetical protein
LAAVNAMVTTAISNPRKTQYSHILPSVGILSMILANIGIKVVGVRIAEI